MIDAKKSMRLESYNNVMKKIFANNVDLLNSQLADIELSEQEEKTLLLLCENDLETIQNIASIIQKVRGTSNGE